LKGKRRLRGSSTWGLRNERNHHAQPQSNTVIRCNYGRAPKNINPMSQPKITREEVLKAYLQLEQDGKEPTALKIRARLGNRGSLETIQKMLQVVREDQTKGIDAKAAAESFNGVWQAAVQFGEKRADADVKRQAEEITALTKKLDAAEVIGEHLKAEIHEASIRISCATVREKELLEWLLDARSNAASTATPPVLAGMKIRLQGCRML
jgi:hypothetical protein